MNFLLTIEKRSRLFDDLHGNYIVEMLEPQGIKKGKVVGNAYNLNKVAHP